MFVVAEELDDHIRKCAASRSPKMAVAYWGKKAIDRLQLPNDCAHIQIACDAFSGGCNPVAISALLERGASVFNIPKLHAKVYIGSAVVVCSANASTNGLGEEDGELSGSIEAGMVNTDSNIRSAATRWFLKLIKHAHQLDADSIPQIEDAWKRNARGRHYRNDAQRTLLDVLLNDPLSLDKRGMHVIFRTDHDFPASVEKTYVRSGYFDKKAYDKDEKYPFYWDTASWAVPIGSHVLDISCDGDAVECEGTWRVVGFLRDRFITALEFESKPFGIPFPKSDRTKLSRLVQAAIRNGRIVPNIGLRSVSALVDAIG